MGWVACWPFVVSSFCSGSVVTDDMTDKSGKSQSDDYRRCRCDAHVPEKEGGSHGAMPGSARESGRGLGPGRRSAVSGRPQHPTVCKISIARFMG